MPETDPPEAGDGWVQVAATPPLDLPAVYRYELEGVVVFESDGRLYGVGRWCPHGWADLRTGWCVDGAVHCPLHGFRFDLATGRCLTHKAFRLETYEVRLSETGVFLRKRGAETAGS